MLADQASIADLARHDWAEHVRRWNALASKLGSRQVRMPLHAERKRMLLVRLSKHPRLWDEVEAEEPNVCDEVRSKGFITFDFLIGSETKLAKYLEGNYRNGFGGSNGAKGQVDRDTHWMLGEIRKAEEYEADLARRSAEEKAKLKTEKEARNL